MLMILNGMCLLVLSFRKFPHSAGWHSRLKAAVTLSEKLCLSWAKLFHIPVPAANFGHVFAPNHIRLAVSLGTSGLKPLLLRGFAITVFCNLLIISY
ncbi:MAG: hypothetical protein MJY76_07310, partial [Bacteroidales bacterium]|nr:hypothetical protein [Bacteroidales bacterium]